MITVLTGPNSFAIAQAIHEQSSDSKEEVETFDAAELEARDLPDIFTGVTLFSTHRVVIIRGTATNKTLWAELEQWIVRVPDEIEILLIEPSLDKRTRTYKLLQKHATIREFVDLNEAELIAWLEVHARSLSVELQPDLLRYFVSYVGHDQWRLKSELEKLLLAKVPITKSLIRDIAEPYPEATAFELLDSVFAGSDTRIHQLLSLLREREDPYQFFGLLSSQVLALYAISCGGSRRPDEIARDMALHPFVVKKLSTIARKLGKKNIVRLIERLSHADQRIKTTGVEPWHQLELTLLKHT